LIAYVNADILLLGNFAVAVQQASRQMARFLLVSERINLEVLEPIRFEEGWERTIQEYGQACGELCGYTGIDVFVFPKGTYSDIPDFGLGRLWFDQWLIKSALQNGNPVVDLSRVALVIHQNHDYNHVPGGADQVWRGKEAEHNLRLYGGVKQAFTLRDATHELTLDGRIRKVRLRKKKSQIREFAWDLLVRRTAGVRAALGLRRKSWQL
jgi:hypothetical protein